MTNRSSRSKADRAAHVTPYDKLSFDADSLTAMLASGTAQAVLTDFFGPALYEELATLAQEVRRTRTRGGPRVYVLPGIMGSQLGLLRAKPKPPDVLWVDPIDIAFGRLTKLTLSERSPVLALGVLLYGYIKLHLRLQRAGFDPILWDYDWRRTIEDSGRRFAAQLREDSAREILVVAHSMGGLVARHALTLPGSTKVKRLILLGTPNFGSLAAVQGLRGTYSVVRKVAMLDFKHSAEQLADQVFGSFPSLYQLLPPAGRAGQIDLFKRDSWPRTGPQPRDQLLEASANLEQRMAPADSRFAVIVGTGRTTATEVARQANDFVYTFSSAGDGTVPTALALLPGAPTYYLEAAHSDLPRSPQVIDAVQELLASGATAALARHDRSAKRSVSKWTDSALRRLYVGKIDWARLTPAERRAFLDSLNEPPTEASMTRGVLPAATMPRRGALLGVAVQIGDIVSAKKADAIALAMFHGVRPLGAVAAIDRALNGTIRELWQRRMLSGQVGMVTPIPAGGTLGRAKAVLLAGLGRFDALDTRAIEHTAENVGRLARRSGYARLAAVAWGGGAGLQPADSCVAQLAGYLAAAADGSGKPLRHIAFVVRDRATAASVHAALALTIAGADAGSKARSAVLEPLRVAALQSTARPVPLLAASKPRLAYLLVNAERARGGLARWRTALLTAGREAAVFAHTHSFASTALAQLTARVETDGLTTRTVQFVGAALPKLVLHPKIRAALTAVRSNPLAIVHDAAASGVAWETMRFNRWVPALAAGLSRRFQSSDLAPARFDARLRMDHILRVLLIVNPTRDLPGAELERERLSSLLSGQPRVELVEVRQRAATRARVMDELEAGRYDLVHYAGHAFFDAHRRDSSGLILADGDLTGAALARLTSLPPLVFFNACESGRLRRGGSARRATNSQQASRPGTAEHSIERNVSLAESLLRAGVANYIGTHWPVSDSAATEFASVFHARLLKGDALGPAVVAARRAVEKLRSPDWADYIHYGDPEFVLKDV